jgi:hypothetical protein
VRQKKGTLQELFYLASQPHYQLRSQLHSQRRSRLHCSNRNETFPLEIHFINGAGSQPSSWAASGPCLMLRVLLSLAALVVTQASLCYPTETKRAYVTSYTGTEENLLKIRVLKKSLRKSGSKIDVVILMPEIHYTTQLKDLLTGEGSKIHLVKEKIIQQFPEGILREVLPLWAFELYEYERIVYLDPYTIAVRNIEMMFSCAGYCASLHAPEGPVVLHPLKDTHAYLLQLLSSGKTHLLSELSQFYNLEHCPLFVSSDSEHSNICSEADYLSVSQSMCHQLPLSFAVPSSHFTASSFTNELICSDCGFDKVKLIVFPEAQSCYEAFFFTEKAIHYRWQAVRSLLPLSTRDLSSAFLSFSLAIILILGMLWGHRRGTIVAAVASSADPTDPSPRGLNSDSEIGNEPPPSSSLAGLRITSVPTVKLLCQGFVVTVLVSLWYHLSLLTSKSVLSFLWEPNVALAVSFIWMTVSLLTGLQLVDYTYLMLQCAPRFYLAEGAVFLAIFWVVGLLLPSEQRLLLLPLAMGSLSIGLSLAYVSRFGSLKDKWFVKRFGSPVSSVTPYCGPLVTKEDLSLLLAISLACYVVTMSSTLLNFPDSLRSLILRCVTMAHATAVISLFVTIIYGLSSPTAPGGDSTLILCLKGLNPLTKHHLSSAISSCRPYFSFLAWVCRQLLHPLLLLLLTIVIVFAAVYYILFVSHQATVPQTSPYFCLKQRGVFINPNGGVSPMCGAAEAMSLHDTGLYSETFAQHYICLEAAPSQREVLKTYASNPSSSSHLPDSSLVLTGLSQQNKQKFLTVHRGVTSSTCSSVSQFFFTTVSPSQVEDGLGYCIYNPLHGIFLSSKLDGELSCQRTEMWLVEPSHRWTHLWGILGQLSAPLRYDFTHQHPLAALLLLLLSILALKRVSPPPLSLPPSHHPSPRQLSLSLNQRSTLALIVLILSTFLLHTGSCKLLWGSRKYEELRENLTGLMTTALSRLGLPNGPQFLRLVSTTPEQCPETVWLASLVLSTSNLVLLLSLLWSGMFRYAPSSTAEEEREERDRDREKGSDQSVVVHHSGGSNSGFVSSMQKQKSLSDLSDKDLLPPSPRRLRQATSFANMADYLMAHDPEDHGELDSQEPPKGPPLTPQSSSSLKQRFVSRYAVSSVVVSYLASVLLLDALVSLLTPIQSLGSHPSSKSSCLYFEKRFQLIGFETEYVDTVVLVSVVLFHCSWRYGRSSFIKLLGMGLALATWVLVWLTVESAYCILPLRFLLTYLSWQQLVPRSIPYVASLVNDNQGREAII